MKGERISGSVSKPAVLSGDVRDPTSSGEARTAHGGAVTSISGGTIGVIGNSAHGGSGVYPTMVRIGGGIRYV